MRVILAMIALATSAHAAPPMAFDWMVRAAQSGSSSIYDTLVPTAHWWPSYTLDYTDIRLGVVASNMGDAYVSADGFVLDGTGDYLDAGFAAAIEPQTNSYSMSAWLYQLSTPVAGIVGKSFSGAGDRWVIYADFSAGSLRPVFIFDDGVTSLTTPTPSTGSKTGEWVHVAAVTLRGSYAKMYLNGIEVGSVAGNSSAVTYTNNVTAPFRFGCYNNAAGAPANYLRGNLDNIAIYNGRALASNEVLQLYQAGRTYP